MSADQTPPSICTGGAGLNPDNGSLLLLAPFNSRCKGSLKDQKDGAGRGGQAARALKTPSRPLLKASNGQHRLPPRCPWRGRTSGVFLGTPCPGAFVSGGSPTRQILGPYLHCNRKLVGCEGGGI